MNKLKKYADILTKYLHDFKQKNQQQPDGLTTIAIIDKENHHYQLAVHGYSNYQPGHVFIVQFHFDIIDGKIWIQKNNTDHVVEEDLLELGVPKSDIVFGCVPEFGRYLSGFGVEKEVAVENV